MHIIHIASEMAGLAKVGGLGDVLLGLSREVQAQGHTVDVIVPKYSLMNYEAIDRLQIAYRGLWSFGSSHWHHNTVWTCSVKGVRLYLIEPHTHNHYFEREKIYGYEDDIERFTYFSRAALEFLLKAQINPDIIHLHEWHSAIVAPLYWDLFHPIGLDQPGLLYTIHNLEHQGRCSPQDIDNIGLNGAHYLAPDKMQDDQNPELINLTKGGITFSNYVTTVSPTYAKEVLTPEGGHGLDQTMVSVEAKFQGILNGLDYDHWNPQTDPYLPISYDSKKSIKGKKASKDELRHRFSMSIEDKPLVAAVTRLVPQKGIHLIKHAIFRTLELGGQFVLLGSTADQITLGEFYQLKVHFANNPNIHIELQHNEELVHLIYAGSDIFLIPSLFEPCGLTQLIALRYGSIPLARRTGGLADTVFDVDYDQDCPIQNGYCFEEPTKEGITSALDRALECYKTKRWKQLVQNGMELDHSWIKPASQYIQVYQQIQKQLHAKPVGR